MGFSHILGFGIWDLIISPGLNHTFWIRDLITFRDFIFGIKSHFRVEIRDSARPHSGFGIRVRITFSTSFSGSHLQPTHTHTHPTTHHTHTYTHGGCPNWHSLKWQSRWFFRFSELERMLSAGETLGSRRFSQNPFQGLRGPRGASGSGGSSSQQSPALFALGMFRFRVRRYGC